MKKLDTLFLERLQEEIGVRFHDLRVLQRALTHRSYLNENRNVTEHNELLEFLGDAALEWVVTHYLFRRYGDENEGTLTNIRAKIVNGVTLSLVAEKLGLADHLRASRGGQNELENPRSRSRLLANTLEAVIGAIAVDRGLGTAELFVIEYLLPLCDEVVQKRAYYDPKSYLQELVQERLKETPTYQVLEEQGLDHARVFTIGCYVGKRMLAKASGSSKGEAEAAAALIALKEEFRAELPGVL